MANQTITKTITQPEEVINEFADNLGYQTIVTNPNYVPAQGSEQIVDPAWTAPENADPLTEAPPMIPNPDHVPAVGEQMIDNPQTRLEFVSERFDEFVSEKFFGQFAKRDAERLKMEEAKAVAKQTVDAIKATITTKVG